MMINKSDSSATTVFPQVFKGGFLVTAFLSARLSLRRLRGWFKSFMRSGDGFEVLTRIESRWMNDPINEKIKLLWTTTSTYGFVPSFVLCLKDSFCFFKGSLATNIISINQ